MKDNVQIMKLGDPEDTLVGLAGDWHGNVLAAKNSINGFSKKGVSTVFQLGDFGIWPGLGGKKFLNQVEHFATGVGITIYVTLGNHEDYDQVDEFPVSDDGLQWVKPHIALFPRIFRFEHGGRSFLSFGGAPSIDYEYRNPGTEWWPQEQITEEQMNEAIAGGGVEVMLTHDAPDNGTRAVQRILDGNPMGWSKKALAYAAEGRHRMTAAVQAIKPEMLAHGHYHALDAGTLAYDDGTEGAIYSLNLETYPGNSATLDLTDLSVELIGEYRSKAFH